MELKGVNVENKYSEWRVLTPALLALLSALFVIVGYLVVDKLNTMNDRSDKLFVIIGGIKSSFEDYQIRAEGRFSSIETQLSDIKAKQ